MSTAEETFDPSRRRLCPDGACVGLLDERGRCKVCGRAEGDAPGDDDFAPPPARSGADAGVPGAEAGGFDPNRKLCADGACIGVIGADGRCSVCGRPAGEA